ncbi:hypothetical protein [Sediminibacillus sp. JSM 1682029]|uniref:hypothetical protein n=1 Tax=Sediminibacillus sp. JSM 1682029 TaxID=3229857 RepID=UPI0035258F74
MPLFLATQSVQVWMSMPMPPSIINVADPNPSQVITDLIRMLSAASIDSHEDRTNTLVLKDWKETIMFGISSLGWMHTLSSLPAIPLAIYMFARYGRIVPRSRSGIFYFISMLIGAITVFPIAHQSVSYVIGTATILLLLTGYSIGRIGGFGRAGKYLETISLSLTAFLLMVPTVTETLTRVPDGNPIAADVKSPILLGAQAALFVILIVGLTAQIIHLRREGRVALIESPIEMSGE